MASSSRKSNVGRGSGYDIPSSIVSLPTRLQRKIQKETEERKLNNAENRSELTNTVQVREKSEPRYLVKNDKKFDEAEQRRNKDNARHENYSVLIQSPQRNCNSAYQQQGMDINGERGGRGGGENAIKMSTSSTGFSPKSTVLIKERSQHSLKESCSSSSLRKGVGVSNHGIIGIGGTFHQLELPSWFKNSEILDKNDYWRRKMQDLTNLHSKYFELFENDETILKNWSIIMEYRKLMNDIFTKILKFNLKFCCKENVEMYFWKILYYNLIEWLRRSIQQLQQQQQQNNGGGVSGGSSVHATIIVKIKDLKMKALQLIHDGIQFYDDKLKFLEQKYFHQNVIATDTDTTTAITTANYNQKYELLAKILKQKFLIHLGDLFRYKEQIENRNNFQISKNYYEIAQKLIPSNGIPYNQLAIISIYYKRIFDAIYYYMRSLCASNPIYSAKESLKELFDEIRKKHEENINLKYNNLNGGRQQQALSKLSKDNRIHSYSPCTSSNMKKPNLPLKKEIWIHPNGSRRLHRFDSFTTKQLQYCFEEQFQLISLNYDDELLKHFTSNYLYLLGKLFTGIGMENFLKILHQMLIEFKLLIFHNSFQFPKNRLLQIIALNIFVIEYNRKKMKQINEINEGCSSGNCINENGYSGNGGRGGGGGGELGAKEMIIWNHAFNTSSLIFGIILNRINEILKELFFDNNSDNDELSSPSSSSSSSVLKLTNQKSDIKEKEQKYLKSKYMKKEINYEEINSVEIKSLIQAIKIWCDWLEKNINYWNTTKCFATSSENYNFLNDYEIINPWNGLAQLTTLLSCINFENDDENGSMIQSSNIKLMEDNYFNGFLPLNNTNTLDTMEEQDNSDTTVVDEKLEMVKRLQHIKRFGLAVLCKCEPPVFEKVVDAEGAIVYIKSVIKECDNDNNDSLESFENFDEDPDYSEEDEISASHSSTTIEKSSNNAFEENKNEADVLELIKRKQELEEKTKQRQIYQQKLENLLENSETIFHIEVRPKYLIPDTNCFIDFLDLLKTIALNSKRYILAIPIVVCNELEGLSKGFKISSISTLQATSSTIRHFDEVTIRAREALDFIKCKKYFSIKYITTKGSILNTSNFIIEENNDENDELNGIGGGGGGGGGRRREHSMNSNDDRILQTAINLCNRTNIERKLKDKIFIQTECVLLTTDRNLRVKALSRNLSVSQLKEFISWAKIFEN